MSAVESDKRFPRGEAAPKGAEEECGRKSGVQASVQTSYQALSSRHSSSDLAMLGHIPPGGRVYMCALKHENRGLGIFPSPRLGIAL